MQNQSQTKKSKLKWSLLSVLALAVFSILGIALLFFTPIPPSIEDIAKGRKIERCIYTFGVAYSIPPAFDDDFTSLVDSNANPLCVYGGIGGLDAAGPCKAKICSSVYGN